MSAPSVSIILPIYNGETFLPATLASIAAQTYRSYELIVVDDGSTDESATHIHSWKEAHPMIPVAYIKQDNAGVAAARNTGVNAARGEYIAFIDQDDVWDAEKLYAQTAALEKTGALWHYTAFIRFYADGREKRKDDGISESAETWRRLMAGVLFIPPSVALVRAGVCRATPFEAALAPSDDWDFFLRLSRAYACVYDAVPRVRFRSHAASTAKQQRRKLFIAQLACLNRHRSDVHTAAEARAVRRRHARILWHLSEEHSSAGERGAALRMCLSAFLRDPWRVKYWGACLRCLARVCLRSDKSTLSL